MAIDTFTESLRVFIFTIAAFVFLVLVILAIEKGAEIIRRRHRARAWWTSRPDLEEWINGD